MAKWAHSSGTIIRPYRSPLGAPQIRQFQESTCAATAVIKIGDLVSFDTVVTTGTRRIVRTPSSGGTSTNLMQVGGGRSFVGVAVEASTSDGSTTGLGANGAKSGGVRMLSVAIADGHTEFLGYMSTAGSSAVTESSLIGLNKCLLHDRALGRWFVDSTNSTVALVAIAITDVPPDNVGDTNGPVVFRFLSTNVSGAVAIAPSVT